MWLCITLMVGVFSIASCTNKVSSDDRVTVEDSVVMDIRPDKITEATSALRSAEESLGPNRVELVDNLYTLADLYEDKGDLDQVAAMYHRAAKIGASNSTVKAARYEETLERLTRTYLKLERFDMAVPFFDAWVELQRISDKVTSAQHYLFLEPLAKVALKYTKAGSYEFTAMYYEKAMSLMDKSPPKHPMYHHMLVSSIAHFYLKNDKFELAEKLFQRLLPLPKHRPDALRSLGKIYREMGDEANAVKYESQAKSLGQSH